MRIARLMPFAMLVLGVQLAGCASQLPAEPWERADHTPPSVTDTSYCRQEARHQAHILYPGQGPNDARGLPRVTDQRNFPTEVRFYEQCMTRLGYVRANAMPPR